ncbi:MAG: hypothetical protein WC210_08260, partial [Candidatus Neomarinimicrobiota bacterium]
ENFKAQIMVREDGSYHFAYEGNLASVFALAAIKEGSFTQKNESEMREEAKNLKKEPGFKSAEYIGKGRYRVSVVKSGKPGEAYDFISRDMQIISIQPEAGNILLIKTWEPGAEDIEQIRMLGAEMKGLLEIQVPKAMTVIEHDSKQKPEKDKTQTTYTWKISMDSPSAKIRLK